MPRCRNPSATYIKLHEKSDEGRTNRHGALAMEWAKTPSFVKEQLRDTIRKWHLQPEFPFFKLNQSRIDLGSLANRSAAEF